MCWFWNEVQGLVIIVEKEGCSQKLNWVWEVGLNRYSALSLGEIA